MDRRFQPEKTAVADLTRSKETRKRDRRDDQNNYRDAFQSLKVVNEDQMDWSPTGGYFKKVLLSEQDLESPGNVVQLLKVEGSPSISQHYHDNTTEKFYVLGGRAVLFVGDTILCKPKETHGIVNNSSEDFILAVFKLNAAKDDTYWKERSLPRRKETSTSSSC